SSHGRGLSAAVTLNEQGLGTAEGGRESRTDACPGWLAAARPTGGRPACGMRDYASIRLTLDCTTPATVPTIIVRNATVVSAGIQCACIGSNAQRNTRTNAANAAALTPVDMKPVTRIGAPW